MADRGHRIGLPFLVALTCGHTTLGAQAPSRCAPNDSAAAAAVRTRLAEWVTAANRGDRAQAREVWAPNVVGWFSRALPFSDSAAYATAGVPYQSPGAGGTTTFELTIDDVVASGPVVVVHDLWTETRHLPGAGAAVRRLIRGSELWKCQPDGRWRIARYVSAPEPWAAVPR